MNFDLNIDNYTKDELVEMFGLPSNYDPASLEGREMKMKENILHNQQISKEVQLKTLNFLQQAKQILLSVISSTNLHNLSSIGKDLVNATESIYHMNQQLTSVPLQASTEHMVQERPSRPYVSSYPKDYFDGVINPIVRTTILKNLNIDTRFRENYYTTTSTNFNAGLPTTFNNVLSMELSAIELPESIYTVSKKYDNNYFNIIVNGEAKIVTIPDGSYSNHGIITSINNALANLGGNFAFVTFTVNLNTLGNTLDLGETNGSGQVIITVDATSNIQTVTINFQADRRGIDDRNTPLPLKLGWMLGFRNGIYENNLNYVSEGVIDVLGPKYFFLVIDDHNNNVNNGFFSAFNSSVLNNNILARISFSTTSTLNGIDVYPVKPTAPINLLTSKRQYFGPVNITSITIQLVDRYGRIVDLNNMDFSFCLSLTTAYDV